MKHIHSYLTIMALLTVVLAPLSHAASMSVNEIPLTTIDQYLGTLDGVGQTLLISPDCQHIALAVKLDQEMGWQIDGNTPKYFPDLGPGQWSPDSKHFSYSVPDGKKWRMVIDGKTESAYDAVGFPVWSPDSSKMSYVAQQNRKFFVINGNQKSQPFEAVRDLQYNGDGSSLAAIVQKDNKDYLWIDGQLKSSADQIEQLVWSAHGAHFALAARDGGAWRIFHDNLPPTKAVETVQLLTISPDGQHIAYVGTVSGEFVVQQDGNKPPASSKTQLLIADEKTLESHNEAGYTYTGIKYSPDSQHLAWTAGYFGQVVAPLPIIPPPPNFPTGGATGMHVFNDGKIGPGYTNVSAPVWSSDSAHLAYGAVQVSGNSVAKYIITDGEPSSPYSDVTQPAWNPTSPELAYAMVPDSSRGQSLVINNGKESPKYDTVSDLRFSADGKYFSYLALGEKGTFTVINGVQGPIYDGFLGDTKSYFDAADHLHVIALKKLKVIQVEFAVKE
ncbi:MAG: hypothetical protein ABI210_13685 [Abditibacteriaceae bacterium]